MSQGMAVQRTKEEVEQVARVYKSIKDAARALGIAEKTFSKLCRRYGVETPYQRKKRESRIKRSRRRELILA